MGETAVRPGLFLENVDYEPGTPTTWVTGEGEKTKHPFEQKRLKSSFIFQFSSKTP
jgi:hypothetical protein